MQREILVVPYDVTWKVKFEHIKLTLQTIFGDLATDIQHIGSTSVVGMSAKPIIDVMVIVHDIAQVDCLNENLQLAGYVVQGEHGICGRRYFQKFNSDNVNHLEHIHCYEKDHPSAINQLMFRDFLNINREAFEEYKTIKVEGSEKFRYSLIDYSNYKSDCVTQIMKQAKIYYSK